MSSAEDFIGEIQDTFISEVLNNRAVRLSALTGVALKHFGDYGSFVPMTINVFRGDCEQGLCEITVPPLTTIKFFYPNVFRILGDKNCVFNAQSPWLQCAINPMGDCSECEHKKLRP